MLQITAVAEGEEIMENFLKKKAAELESSAHKRFPSRDVHVSVDTALRCIEVSISLDDTRSAVVRHMYDEKHKLKNASLLMKRR